MSETAFDRLCERLREHGSMVKATGQGKASAQCPAHEDRGPSLSITDGGGLALLHCHAGCDTTDVLTAVGATKRDLFDDPRGAEYRYDDGRVVHRSPEKKFWQEGNTESRPQLYRLAEVQRAVKQDRRVFLVEGEKDVHAIAGQWPMVCATTAPQGANNFARVDVGPLAGARVVVIVDQDEAGAKWASHVAGALGPIAAQIEWKRAAVGKDAADHIAAGMGIGDLCNIDPPNASGSDGASRFASSLLRRSALAHLPPVEPLIDGVLSLRTAAVLFGPTGAGKTFLALGWACSVGTGTSWLGHPVVRAPVLYVVGEGAAGLDHRVSAWEYAWGQKVGDDDVVWSVKPDSFTDMNTWAELRAEALGLGVRFVVLDTFSSLAPDADETKDAPTFTRRLSDLAEAIDGTALAVHHPGWSDADRTRGGYQLEANVDEVLKLSGTAGSDLVELTRKKVKEGASGARMWLRRRPIDLGTGDASVIIEAASNAERLQRVVDDAEAIVREVFASGQVSKAQVRDALIERLGVSRTGAYEQVMRLIAAGVLRRAGGSEARPVYEVA